MLRVKRLGFWSEDFQDLLGENTACRPLSRFRWLGHLAHVQDRRTPSAVGLRLRLSEPLRVQFGLGSAEKADLEVRWPSRVVDTVPGVAANHVVKIT